MAVAEDGDPQRLRPAAEGSEPDDALDDAAFVWLYRHEPAQRPGSLLDNIKYYQYGHAVLRYRGLG